MKIIKPYVTVEPFDGVKLMQNIERYARVCYKSENKITEDSYKKMLPALLKRGHESVIEHEKLTAIFVVDRGISHEIVRHRIASYSQESTRYCNYDNDKFGNEITVIEPFFWSRENVVGNMDKSYCKVSWEDTIYAAESAYFELLRQGATPEEARSVLPNSLKTEIVVTFNLREWRHFFKLRADKAAHPQMREVAIPLLLYFKGKMPELFNDIPYDKSFPTEHYAEIKEECVIEI